MSKINLEERLEISASKMGLRLPFIMAATAKLPRIVSDDPRMTAATNGTWLKFGRPWVEENVKDDEELFGLDLHERMHVVWMHMWRRDGRYFPVWNIANDAIINATIISMGYKLPAGGVHISWVTPDMDSEEVYNRLMQEATPPDDAGDDEGEGEGGSEGEGEGEGGKGVKGKGAGMKGKKGKGKTKAEQEHGNGGWEGAGDLDDAPEETSSADMEATIRAAAQMARDCGDTSIIVNRILESVPKASVNWKDEVRAALTSVARDDFSYRKFSRRFLSRGMYLPALHSDAMGGLLIGFDTSGSMSVEDCNQVGGEIQGIVNDLNPDWVEVVYCDAVITHKQRFVRGDDIRLEPRGGGGTRFKPVFDYAEELQAEKGEKIAAMIYLTDMEGNLHECQEPEFPVVWGNVYGSSNATAPFGSVVRVIV